MLKCLQKGENIMLGKKIRYYRLKNGLTSDELANMIGCTKASISLYESDSRTPDGETSKKIADALGITLAKLFNKDDQNLLFDHKSFRKKQTVSKKEIELLKSEIEQECSKRISLLNILGDLPTKPFKPKQLSMDSGVYENAKIIRKEINIPQFGPFYEITNSLENIGIIVISFACDENIDGLNGTVNNIPYIFFNSNIKTIERQRSTVVHELCHLFFNDLEDTKENEKYITELAANVLLPSEDIFKEFGKTNRNITIYLRDTMAKRYKIAPSLLIMRLFESGVITESYQKNFFIYLNKNGGRKAEKSFLSEIFDSEKPTLFIRQVYRALSDELITASKAAEFLSVPLIDVMNNMRSI